MSDEFRWDGTHSFLQRADREAPLALIKSWLAKRVYRKAELPACHEADLEAMLRGECPQDAKLKPLYERAKKLDGKGTAALLRAHKFNPEDSYTLTAVAEQLGMSAPALAQHARPNVAKYQRLPLSDLAIICLLDRDM